MGRFRRATPGGGEEKRAEQFRYTKTQPGLKGTWAAWCAAKPYWCKAHEHTDKTPGTKVCLHWFTDGALSCPRCRPGVIASDIAYVFLWREEDLAPCLVICHESVADLVAPLDFGVYCLVGCAQSQSSVYVRPAEQQRRWSSSLPYRQGPCDIEVSLLTLWNYPALDAWVKLPQPRRVDGIDSQVLPARLRLSVPPPTTDIEALAVDAEKKGGETWDDLKRRVLARTAKPGKNGKHHGGTDQAE